jgi:ligand-binding sensor domain-containing protein
MGLYAFGVLHATRLPIRTYTTADGLARDHILCIAQDSHGFLWFCTAEGLSRFDGYRFANYTTAQGLPTNEIEDFLETRAGLPKSPVPTAFAASTFAAFRRTPPPRTRMPRRARPPMAATIAVGVARISAHGQATISTATVRSQSRVKYQVSAPASKVAISARAVHPNASALT